MDNIIVVNNVAASSGGAKSILDQFLEEVTTNTLAKNYLWYVFVSNDLYDLFHSVNVKIIQVNAKKWGRRLVWDTVGIKLWLRKRNITPVLALSMMSVGFRTLKAKQVVYIHQPLPFSDSSMLKWFEWKTRVFRNMIFQWMKFTITERTEIIVQTSWMKTSVQNRLGISPDRLHIITPAIPAFRLDSEVLETSNQVHTHILFYPSIPAASYKNYDLLIDMMNEMRQEAQELFKKIKIVLTCTKEEPSRLVKYYVKRQKKMNLEESFLWAGYLDQQQMSGYYTESDLILFPSLLETFGLPLIEASSFGKTVLVQDLPYARDVLKNYEGAIFIENDPLQWSRQIVAFYSSQPKIYTAEASIKGEWSKLVTLINDIAQKT